MRASKYLPQDLNARIDGGVCFYKGEPFVIEHSSEKTGSLYELSSTTPLIHANIPLSSTDLDISSPPLGYANTDRAAIYFWRRPDRRYKQTLTPNNLSAEAVLGKMLGNEAIRAVFFSSYFRAMLKNEYPSVDEAFVRITKTKVTSVALSRNVALAMDSFGAIRVFFKRKFVGTIPDLNAKVVNIPKSEDAWVVSKYLSSFSWVVN